MARDFSKNTANYVSLGANRLNPLLAGAARISVHAWINVDSYSAGMSDNRVLGVQFDNSNGSALLLLIDGSGANKVVRLYARSQLETLQTRAGLVNVSTGAWHGVGGVIDFPGDTIRPYLDGAADNPGGVSFGAASYTPGTPTTATDVVGANIAPPTGANFQLDGRIAELALWRDDIGAAGFAALGQGFSPLLVRPQALVFYLPLRGYGGAGGPEIVPRGGGTATIGGSVPVATHPRGFGPAGATAVSPPGVSGWPLHLEAFALPVLSPGLIS